MLNKDTKPRALPSRTPATARSARPLHAHATAIERTFARLLHDDQETSAAIADLIAPRAPATQH